jgi:hypothetical protein
MMNEKILLDNQTSKTDAIIYFCKYRLDRILSSKPFKLGLPIWVKCGIYIRNDLLLTIKVMILINTLLIMMCFIYYVAVSQSLSLPLPAGGILTGTHNLGMTRYEFYQCAVAYGLTSVVKL